MLVTIAALAGAGSGAPASASAAGYLARAAAGGSPGPVSPSVPASISPSVPASISASISASVGASVPGPVVLGAPDLVGSRTTRPASSDGATPYRPPTATPRLARPFLAPAQRWSSGHRGVDLWLDPGTPVLSPAAGTVTFAGTVVDRGVVTVLHPDGRRTSLEPVTPDVVVGQHVAAGDAVGRLQDRDDHCPGRSCLHWGLREGDRYLDPVSVLPGGGPVVLLPVADDP